MHVSQASRARPTALAVQPDLTRPGVFDVLWAGLMVVLLGIGMTVCLCGPDAQDATRHFDVMLDPSHQSDATVPVSAMQAAP